MTVARGDLKVGQSISVLKTEVECGHLIGEHVGIVEEISARSVRIKFDNPERCSHVYTFDAVKLVEPVKEVKKNFAVVWDEGRSDPIKFFEFRKDAVKYAEELVARDNVSNIMLLELKSVKCATKKTVIKWE